MGPIRSLANARDLQLQCARVLHEIFLVPVLMYGCETMLYKEKERYRVRAAQMDTLRGLLGFRRMDRVPNERIRELYGVKKGLDEKIDEGILRWFGHVENMERDRIFKRVYVGECAVSRSVGGSQKRWIDTVKEFLKKRDWISGKQGEWSRIGVNVGGFIRGNACSVVRVMKPWF